MYIKLKKLCFVVVETRTEQNKKLNKLNKILFK